MAQPRRRILVIDDQIGRAGSREMDEFLLDYRSLLDRFEFLFEDCRIDGAEFSSDRAVAAIREAGQLDLVLLDVKFGADDDRLGFEILERIRARFGSLPVVMMTSLERDVENIARSLEPGAVAFISKRPAPEELTRRISDAIAISRDYAILGNSGPIRNLRREIAKISPYENVPVVILGERGTGKERVARNIHHTGPRRDGPFVGLNCAGLSAELLESELFGHEKGAFTGADRRREGYLAAARGGTLFLDEVSEIPMRVQVDLLRVLEERRFRRVGSSGDETVMEVQLLSATNAAPQQLLRSGQLREDFYDRIAAFVIRTPPLRDCVDDIPELARYFLGQTVSGSQKALAPLTVKCLEAHDWPGNGRELKNVIWRAAIKSGDAKIIDPEFLPAELQSPRTGAKSGSSAARADAPPDSAVGLPEDQLERANYLSRRILEVLGEEAAATAGNAAAMMRDLFPGQTDNKRYLGQVAWKLVDWNPGILANAASRAAFESCEPLWSAFIAYLSSSPLTRQKLWDKLRRYGITPPSV